MAEIIDEVLIIEGVARILSKGCWDGCEVDGELRCCLDPPCPCREVAREIVSAMRIPTAKMITAGDDPDAPQIYERMIVAALAG